jgi:hypothetical protein
MVSFPTRFVGFMDQPSRLGDVCFDRSSNLCFSLISRGFNLPHDEDFSAAIRVRLGRRLLDWIYCVRATDLMVVDVIP